MEALKHVTIVEASNFQMGMNQKIMLQDRIEKRHLGIVEFKEFAIGKTINQEGKFAQQEPTQSTEIGSQKEQSRVDCKSVGRVWMVLRFSGSCKTKDPLVFLVPIL